MSERVGAVAIEQELRESYLDYAMSVIVARALPDVRDGLKPVQRRILFAMAQMGLWPDQNFRKCARIVGEVLGKYHPHGEAAVYDALVRMAQSFTMRYPLVHGQGNFGSLDGDGAAAMRYTEARLAPIARELVSDLHDAVVPFAPNFDASLREPTVLPVRIPNLLVNGATGIAVGMATSIPPHNLAEVIDALVYLLARYEKVDSVSTQDLLRYIAGPDFPTGGILFAGDSDDSGQALLKAYASGRGKITVRARVDVEDGPRGPGSRLVVTELPYQVNKARLVERIAELVKSGRIEGIVDIRDESSREGIRIAIELARAADYRRVLLELFRQTPLQVTLSIILLALVDGEPRILSLKRLLVAYIEHRLTVLRKQSERELALAREREHLLAGLLIALSRLDEVIGIVRRSRTAELARAQLMQALRVSERQAEAILSMPLRRLAALERQLLEKEHEECLEVIARLSELLADPEKMRRALRDELLEVKRLYADERRTQVVQEAPGEEFLTSADLLSDEKSLLGIDREGFLCRLSKPGRGRRTRSFTFLTTASLRAEVIAWAADGVAARFQVHLLPEAGASGKVPRAQGDGATIRVRAVSVLEGEDKEAPALLATAAGAVKRVSPAGISRRPVLVLRLAEGDVLAGAVLAADDDFVLLATSKGRGILFRAGEVRVSSLGTGTVAGMKVEPGDELVAVCRREGEHLLLLTASGFLKKIPWDRIQAQRRGGSGVLLMSTSAATGPVVAALGVVAGENVAVVSDRGTHVSIRSAEIPCGARAGRGRQLLQPEAGERFVRMVRNPAL